MFIYTAPYRHGDRSCVAFDENGCDAKFLSFGISSKIRVRFFNIFGYSIDIFGELTNGGTARCVFWPLLFVNERLFDFLSYVPISYAWFKNTKYISKLPRHRV